MLITDYLDSECILTDLKTATKDALISTLAEKMFDKYPEIDREEAYLGIKEREKVLSTGIGNGIAIPHARIKSCKKINVSFGLVPDGADFESIDNQPVHIIFLVFFPADEVNLQLRFLARISRLLTHTSLKNDLLICKTPESVISAFQAYESKHFH